MRITGYTPEEYYSDPDLRTKLVYSEDLPSPQTVNDDEKIFAGPLRLRWKRRDGEVIWTEQLNTPIYDENHALIAVDGIVREVTAQKAEETLRRQVDETARRVQELEALTAVSVSMRQAQTRPDMAILLVNQSMKALSAQGGVLGLIQGNAIHIEGAQGVMAHWQNKVLTQDDSLFWQVIRDGIPRWFERNVPGELPDPFAADPWVASILSPLKSGETVTGLLALAYDTPQVFTEKRRLISAISEMAGSALHRMNVTETLENMVSMRNRELESIYEVTSAASESLDLRASLQHALELTLQAVNTTVGGIFLREEEAIHLVAQAGFPQDVAARIRVQDSYNSLEGWVIQNNKPLVINNLAADERAGWHIRPNELISFLSLPMRIHEQVLGALSVSRPGGETFNVEEMTLLSFVADHLGLVVENAHLFRQYEQNVILEERSRLARELHDSVTQQLYGATLFSAGAKEYLKQGNQREVMGYLDQLQQITQQALKEMRLLVYELRSPQLSQSGLVGAIENRLDAVERRSGLTARMEADDLPPLRAKAEENLYRIALEALNNALKHASAKQIGVALHRQSDHITLIVEDDGIGFDLAKAFNSGGVGLKSIQERADKLHGKWSIITSEGQGCRVEIMVPLSFVGEMDTEGLSDG